MDEKYSSFGLSYLVSPDGVIKAGKFGKCGKMVIAPYNVPEGMFERFRSTFLAHVELSICGCWTWKGRAHNGYGVFAAPGGSSRWAHRVAYALLKGPIDAQRHIDHRCRNRLCVNPAHLRAVTPVENYNAIHKRRRRDVLEALESAGQLQLW